MKRKGLEPGQTRQFARIPLDILTNPALNAAEIKVYGILAATAQQTNLACIGQRRLADLSGVDRRSVRRALASLAKFNYIAQSIFKMNRRTVYELKHPIFTSEESETSGYICAPTLGRNTRPRIDIEGSNSEKLLSMPRSARGAG